MFRFYVVIICRFYMLLIDINICIHLALMDIKYRWVRHCFRSFTDEMCFNAKDSSLLQAIEIFTCHQETGLDPLGSSVQIRCICHK